MTRKETAVKLRGVKVYQYCLGNGDFIGEYDSISDAAEDNDIKVSTLELGLLSSPMGYVHKGLEFTKIKRSEDAMGYKMSEAAMNVRIEAGKKRAVAVEVDGIYFATMTRAEEYANIDNISMKIRDLSVGESVEVYGHTIKKLQESEKRPSIKMYCYKDGEAFEYDTIADAATATGVSAPNICSKTKHTAWYNRRAKWVFSRTRIEAYE